jgi:hypothetical protein
MMRFFRLTIEGKKDVGNSRSGSLLAGLKLSQHRMTGSFVFLGASQAKLLAAPIELQLYGNDRK